MNRDDSIVNIKVILAGIGLGIVLCVAGVIFVLAMKPLPKPGNTQATAILEVWTMLPNTVTADAGEALSLTASPVPQGEGKFAIGAFVQVVNTGGKGLQIRSGAGVENPPNFLAMDAEVFEVKDGPVERDGYTWWYLTAPYDSPRAGWAADSFLDLVIQ